MHPFFHKLREARHFGHGPFGHHHHFGRPGRGGFQGFPFGGEHGFPGGGRGPGGMAPGRKLGSADLQLLILALLADKPSHGYELIKALDERSSGFYAPSPGMVYPALTYLEEVGHASVQVEGNKKLYTLTDDGRAELDKQREQADTLLRQLEWIGQRMAQVRQAMADDGEDSDRIRSARHALKAALVARRGASAEERERIAAILQRAADEIRGT
jgi:DNA-binding PadR family transcriptional regulator